MFRDRLSPRCLIPGWHLTLVLLIGLPAFGRSATVFAADSPHSLSIQLDRDTAVYSVGENATFLIRITSSGDQAAAGRVSYVVDDFLTGGQAAGLPEATVQLTGEPVKVVVSGRRPGFLRCQVTFQPDDGEVLRASAGVAFSPEEIGLSLPVPDDFDEFWEEQKRQLAGVPMKPELTSVDSRTPSIVSFDVQVPCAGGAPVSGYFAKPETAKPGTLPAILWVHGAGVRSSSLSNSLKGAKAGFLSMDINAHGIPNGRPSSFYAELNKGRLSGYRHAGRESRDSIYFRGMYLRLVRAIDFLTAQPEWDGKTVAVVGHSQGGGQSLVAGGLDDRVTIIAPGVPAICDHSGNIAGRVNGWPKLVPNGPDGKPDPQILEAARYIDAVNFATRCKAEAIMSVGFIDAVCPPSSCYAAYNALRGPKTVINEPLMGHAAPAAIQQAFFEKILEHARRSR